MCNEELAPLLNCDRSGYCECIASGAAIQVYFGRIGCVTEVPTDHFRRNSRRTPVVDELGTASEGFGHQPAPTPPVPGYRADEARVITFGSIRMVCGLLLMRDARSERASSPARVPIAKLS